MEIQDYPNYRIYDDGRVWSNVSNRFLKSTVGVVGYLVVGMQNDRARKLMYIHRLLAIHYIPNPENKPTVDHIDRDRTNNRLSNLRWATSLEQNQNLSTRKMLKTNRSGHIGITDKYSSSGTIAWAYKSNKKRHKKIHRQFPSKIDCICYKYIALLKIKAGVI